MKKLLVSLLIIGVALYIFIDHYYDAGKYSETAIEAIQNARSYPVNYIIHEEPVTDGKVVFFLRYLDDGGTVVTYDYVRKSWRGWQRIYGGGQSGSGISLENPDESLLKEPVTDHFVRDLSRTEMGETPFPMLHGIILSSEVSRVVAKDYNTGQERQAKIINLRDKFKLYFVFLDVIQGEKFDIIAFRDDGSVHYRKSIDANATSGGSVETIMEESQ
jgi:hypothetical protein